MGDLYEQTFKNMKKEMADKCMRFNHRAYGK